MSNLQIGDRVMVISDDYTTFSRGEIAEVADITETSVCLVNDVTRSQWMSYVDIDDVEKVDPPLFTDIDGDPASEKEIG